MSVSFRAVGTWAELTADGSVAIPATPQAGDRMYLFARWKDFSITATVANWTELSEFADGAVGSGNGSGSVKVGCWWRDWQSGDTDPTIDFSSSPTNASVVIIVMQKDVDDVWLTPVARTAAMTNWTTSSQIVAASSTVAVPSGGVVMGLIGIRDDTATMTRPTTGIDDSTGAVTWNGNYVESPATHHSTTTGDDGAADLGYRLVSIGATATLRMTGTISAAETGAALWVIQGTVIVVTPSPAALSLGTFTPTLNSGVAPATATLTVTTYAPLLSTAVVSSPATFSITTLTPLLALGVTPAPAALSIATFGPTLRSIITPAMANLTISTFSPELISAVIPGSQPLVVNLFTPTLASVVTPQVQSFSLTTFRPIIVPFNLIYADPGGDSVQDVGYFNTPLTGSTGVSFDPTQKVVGVGSYKFDSLAGGEQAEAVSVAGVFGTAGRFSTYFRYDSVPDQVETVTKFVGVAGELYSGTFAWDFLFNIGSDDEAYAIAAPDKNSGHGMVFDSLGFDTEIPVGAAIDWVKVHYKHKYDVDTSIGITRVKYRIDGIEGPDYDNTDMPLTDTVETVEFTDRGFTREDLLNGVFEVIVEARRGDSDIEHTQSFDYVAVEVAYRKDTIIQALDSINEAGFKIGAFPKGDGVVTRFVDNNGASFLGITELATNTWHRISFAHVQNGSDLAINIYVNSILELSLEGVSAGSSPLANLRYGWIDNSGADHLCWFDLPYVDDGDDLSDTVFGPLFRPPHCTAKLSGDVNENNWSTTGGTGAVNERPLSVTNYRQHFPATAVRQTYTLEAADEGDIDISGETLLGYMGWAWAKKGAGTVEQIFFVVNGVDFDRSSAFLAAGLSPLFLKQPVTSPAYPSDAAGIGMVSNEDTADVFLYECGAVQVYEGPAEESILHYQLLAEDTILNLVDDLRADPPDSYEFCYRSSESETAAAWITITALDQEGGEIQEQIAEFPLHGGSGRTRISAGIEVQVHLHVIGGPISVGLWHRLNVD